MPSGYSIIGIVAWNADSTVGNLLPVWGEYDGSNARIRYYNQRSGAVTVTVGGLVICKKN